MAAASPLVRFVYTDAAATSVAVAGDFNGWSQAAMRRAPGGVWEAFVPAAPGRHQYTFVVDGAKWIADPAAPRIVDDEFGGANGVLEL